MGYLDETGLSRVWNRIKAYIQSLNYTSNIGTVTGITMNNTSYSPVNGDVDIGTVVTDVSSKANDSEVVHTTGDETIFQKKTFAANGEIHLASGWNQIYNEDDDESLQEALNARNNVQADWNQTTTTAADYIKNKPTIPTVYAWAQAATKPSYTAADVGAVPTTRTINGKALSADITLSASDVSALPSSTIIPTVPEISTDIISDGIDDTKTASPKAVKTFVEGKGYLTSETEPDFNGSAAATITSADITAWNGKSIFSGSYNDLTDKPTLFSGAYADLTGKPNLATVATSGDYDDLSNKPTIPSAVTESTVSGWGFTKNAGTITGITMNGASKGTSGVVDLGTVITSHQSLTDYVQKSQTSGLLKNDGTVDQNTYLTTETEPAYTLSAAATLTSSNIVKGASQSYIIWSGTLLEYDAITTKDNNTIYFIKES